MSRRFPAHTTRMLADIHVPTAPVVAVPLTPDLAPADRFILARLPIAARLAWQHARYAPDAWADLFQEACLALVEVARQVPPEVVEDHAEALAVLVMRRRIVMALARRSMAGNSLPAHALRDWLHLRRVAAPLRLELGRDPHPAELAAATGWPVARIAALERALAPPLSLEALGTQGASAGNALEAPQETMRHEAALVRVALAQLPEPERTIIAAQFGIGMRRQGGRALARRLEIAPRTVAALRRRGLALMRIWLARL
jgi:RNA polymerase sigma factor (sigma-70 family)